MDFYTIIALADATVRMAIPLLLACLAGLFSERAGIFDIGLEGKMLAAAFLSAAVSAHFLYNPMGGYAEVELCDARGVCQMVEQGINYIPPVFLGLLAGIFASLLLSGIHGLASITFKGNQLISGVAINFLAAGMTVVIAQGWFGQGGRTPTLSGRDDEGRTLVGGRFEDWDFPGAITRIRDMRDAGPGMQFYSELLSGHTILVYIAFLIVPASWWVLYRTRFGLRLRAVGENPEAVDTAGISVVGLRFAAIAICGVLCGIAGAYLSTAVQSGFTKDMTANRGFIALAALILAKWRPWHAMGACLLFGLFFAIDNRFQNIQVQTLSILVFIGMIVTGLMFYAMRNERIDRIVLGGLSAILVAIGLATWIAGAGAEGATMVSALLETVKIPTTLISSLPYILTVVAVAGFVGKAIPPRAGGEPYVKER